MTEAIAIIGQETDKALIVVRGSALVLPPSPPLSLSFLETGPLQSMATTCTYSTLITEAVFDLLCFFINYYPPGSAE